MTPLHIKLLLHHHCRCEPYSRHDPDHAESPAVSEYRSELILADILTIDSTSGSGYMTTERGKALVEMLCQTPFPESKWINPLTRKIIDDSN